MAFVFNESGLTFSFGDAWSDVVKWDEHPAYRGGLHRFDHTKAVDFVGSLNGETYLIEVKSFRDHRIENKDRLVSGALAAEVADKVRDTIAGMTWAHERAREHVPYLHRMLRPIFVAQSHPRVVLWLEEDPRPRPTDLSVLAERIKQRLRWLTRKVVVVDRRRPIEDVVVTGTPEDPR